MVIQVIERVLPAVRAAGLAAAVPVRFLPGDRRSEALVVTQLRLLPTPLHRRRARHCDKERR